MGVFPPGNPIGEFGQYCVRGLDVVIGFCVGDVLGGDEATLVICARGLERGKVFKKFV